MKSIYVATALASSILMPGCATRNPGTPSNICEVLYDEYNRCIGLSWRHTYDSYTRHKSAVQYRCADSASGRNACALQYQAHPAAHSCRNRVVFPNYSIKTNTFERNRTEIEKMEENDCARARSGT